VDEPGGLPKAKHRAEVTSSAPGHLSAINAEALGTALAILGGGREKKEDAIDHAVGLEFHKRIGDRVAKGEALVTIHYNDVRRLSEAQAIIAASYQFSAEPPRERPKLIRKLIGETQ